MGRSLPAYLAFSALLGWSGCLLFTDPINRAPEVKDVRALDPITRGDPVRYTATISDDKDSLLSLDIEWAVFVLPDASASCLSVNKASWAGPEEKTRLSGDMDYSYTADSTAVACVCAQATDHYGASGFACLRIEPTNKAPTAKIIDVSGAGSGTQRPLCSDIHLSAEKSEFPKADLVDFKWSMTDAAGNAIQLAKCVDATKTDLGPQHRCFYAGVPGTYTVTLSITDTPSSGEASTSNTATFVIPVLADMPPCLQVTDPDAFRQLIFITSSDQDSRTFKVVSVADDCEPYPVPTSSAKQASQFVWSVYDSTRSPPAWLYPDNTTDSFTVSHSMFPNVRLNDAIEVRVEVRDKAVQKSYQTPGYSACSPDVDICCSGNVCSGDNSCIRWTTWSVYFTP